MTINDDNNKIYNFYSFFKDMHFSDCCLAFVYNSIKNCIDEEHISECVYPEEIEMIYNAFSSISELTVYKYDGEMTFIKEVKKLRSKHDKIFVYSMAQNTDGEGRRALIPLFCEHNHLYNISADATSSFLGGNKELMYLILKELAVFSMPKHIFLDKFDWDYKDFLDKFDSVFIKPYNESASIGISLIQKPYNYEEIDKLLNEKISKYKKIFLEEKIEGVEVECTLVKINDEILSFPVIKINKKTDFLDYNIIKDNEYGYSIFDKEISKHIISLSKEYHKKLNFGSISRFDFIANKEKVFLFDISPNPTISELSSSNYAIQQVFNDINMIYKLLFYICYSNHLSTPINKSALL